MIVRWTAELNGQSGLVPANYIEIFKEEPVKVATALYEFNDGDSDHLKFSKGDYIIVTDR